MIKNILLSISLLLVTNLISAQSIKGIIKDNQSQEPLPYSTIILLKAADSVKIKGMLSDDNGNYHFENMKAGNYLLAVQTVGYHKMIVPVNVNTNNIVIDITLSAESNQLKAVTITASKPMVERRADRLVFNVQNSVLAAGNNGLEMLKMAPLVTINPNGGLNLKGKDNVMVMLDGKVIPGETVASLLQSMSAEEIEKFELITSPSAKYDAAATGGIINIITKRGTNMGLNGNLNLAAAQSRYGRYNGGAGLNYRTNKFNIYGNINLRDGKSYKNENLTRYLQNGDKAFTMESPMELFGNGQAQTAKIGIDYNTSKTSILGFNFNGLYFQSANLAKAQSLFRNSAGRLDSVLTSISHPGSHTNFTAYNLNYKNTFNAKGEELLINITQSRYKSIATQNLTGEMATISSSSPIQFISSANQTESLFNITTFQTDYTRPFNDEVVLETGIKDVYTTSTNQSANQSVNFSADNSDFNHTQYKENILAGYINLNYQLKKFKLQTGLRAEFTNAKLNLTGLNSSYVNLFPNISIENKFSDHYQLSLAYSSRIDRPAYRSLIPFVIPIDRYSQEKGNPELKAAYTNSLELTNTFGKVSLTLGYTHTNNAITDFIAQNEENKVWSFTKSNFDKMENYNVSLVVPVTVTKWWTSNNTLFGTKDTYSDNNIGGSSYNRSKFSYNLNSIHTFLLPEDIKGELTASYNSASIYGLYYISHYSMVNAGLSKAFLDKKATIKLGVNDIFHKAGYNISTDAGTLRSSGHSYTDSRRVTVSLSYKFGKKITPARENTNDDAKGRLNL